MTEKVREKYIKDLLKKFQKLSIEKQNEYLDLAEKEDQKFIAELKIYYKLT